MRHLTPLLARAEVEEGLGLALGETTLLITFHPETGRGHACTVPDDGVAGCVGVGRCITGVYDAQCRRRRSRFV